MFDKSVNEHYNFNPSQNVEVVNFNITSHYKKYYLDEHYEIVGIMDHVEKIIFNFIDDKNIEKYLEFRKCDHCKSKVWNRARTIILKDDFGKYIQIGNSCFVEYAHSCINSLVDIMKLVPEDFHNEYNKKDYFFFTTNRDAKVFKIDDVIALIYREIKKNGFTAPHVNFKKSTKMIVFKLLNKTNEYNITEEEKKISDKIISYFKSLEGEDFYSNNLKRIANENYVFQDSIGILCDGINKYLNK